MPSAAFNDALPFVLRWEGGYVNHPRDPGGATNRGVTQKVYDAWRQAQGQSGERSVQLLADDEMRAIYEANYWLPSRCDLLPSPLDAVQFDTAVNMGVGRAVRFLQKAVGTDADGDFGSGTKKCVDGCDIGETLIAYCQLREDFYRSLVARKPDMAVFLKGWLNRLNALRKQVGLPGYEAVGDVVDYGDAGYMAKVPESDDGLL